MELKGKTAIVTGSGRGIGEGIALVLAREGANLVVNDRKITKDAEGVVKKIKAMGGKAIAVEADVSKKSEVTAMADQAVKQFGAIDILVNNAGIESHPVLTMELPEETWDRVMNVNLKGSFLCCQAVIPQMVKQNKGRIINIGSTASIRIAFFGGVEYTASKYGQAGIAAHLAWELADSNITVEYGLSRRSVIAADGTGDHAGVQGNDGQAIDSSGTLLHHRRDWRGRELSSERSRGHDHWPDAPR